MTKGSRATYSVDLKVDVISIISKEVNGYSVRAAMKRVE